MSKYYGKSVTGEPQLEPGILFLTLIGCFEIDTLIFLPLVSGPFHSPLSLLTPSPSPSPF